MTPAPYIREYSVLNPKEQRQLFYKRRYKQHVQDWDDSMVLLTRLVGERLPAAASVLDLGCGHGNFVIDELSGRFSRRVGIDVAPEMTEGNTSVEEVVFGDVTRLPFADQEFDAVISLWVFEHLAFPDSVFQEIFRVLKPGGLLAFATPNRRSLLIRLRRLLSKKTADSLLLKLYGREDKDVFDVYYRANTRQDLKMTSQAAGFIEELLKENADPSYTSFGSLTYAVSRVLSRLPFSLFKPHIIGFLRKPF